MKKLFVTALILVSGLASTAQYRANLGASIGAGATMITLGAEREFNVVSEKFHINPGIRLNVFTGKDLTYITAPAKYTSIDAQVDTLTFKSVQDNFANLYVRIGYDFTKKLALSFDIDVFGISFGAEQANNPFNPGAARKAGISAPVVSANAAPTTLNVLLVGDNDLGSLNSTLALTYKITDKISVGTGYAFGRHDIFGLRENEHRAILQGIYNQKIQKFNLSHRGRYEFRSPLNLKTNIRSNASIFRYQLGVNFPFYNPKTSKQGLYLTAGNEMFFLPHPRHRKPSIVR